MKMDQELKHTIARIVSIALFAIMTVVIVCLTTHVPASLLCSLCLAAIFADVIVGFFVPQTKIEAQ